MKIQKLTPNTPIFKNQKDLLKWTKKRQKGKGSFVTMMNYDCGDMEYNNQFLNSNIGNSSDSSGIDSSAVADGASTDMGESLQLISEKNSKNRQKINKNELIWYQLPSGRMPAKEFYESSSEDIQLSFDTLFKDLKDNSLFSIKDASKLLDSKERIFELRAKDGSHWARITYTRIDGDSILLLGFNKDQNQTPKIEIEKSIKYKKDYIKNNLGEKVEIL